MYAAICAAGILSKEEKDGTAEFLLTHPISRRTVLIQKLEAILIQITVMNVVVYLLSIGSMALIGEAVPWKEVNLMHLAYYCLQLELGGICFGVSAFLRKGSLGVGLGIAVMLYFANLISNMAEVAEGLRYITPFAYCDGADIVTNGNLDLLLLGIGFLFTAAGIGGAFWKYCRKDIQ